MADIFESEVKKKLLEGYEQRMSQGKVPTIHRADEQGIQRSITPQQRLEEMKKGTRIGNEMLMAEYQLMEELARRK